MMARWWRFVPLCLLALLLPAAGLSGDVPPSTAGRFGIVEGFWFPELTCELGVGWERIIFNWEQHQPEGPDDWHTLNVDDRWLKEAGRCGRQVVALLKHTPEWATDGLPGAGVPRGLHLPVDDPGNLWAAFVRRAAAYYASRGVFHFIIWNEPDIDHETYGFEFEGELEDYYLLLRTAYLAAKQGNPDAVIHLAGTTYWHDVNNNRRLYMDRLLERIMQDPEAAQHGFYFDVLSLHIYFRIETVYTIVHEMRELLDGYGLYDKSIWINETNAAPTIDPAWPVVRPVYDLDLEQQAAFLVQAAALGLAAGAERIAAYKLYDQHLPPGGESFGLLSPPDATPRPAFYAWRMVTTHFSDVTEARLTQSAAVNAVHMVRSSGQQVLTAWARTASPARLQVAAAGTKAYLLDSYGNITVLRPDEGLYSILLPGARCSQQDGCFIGGLPLTLIQPPGPASVYVMSAAGGEVLFED